MYDCRCDAINSAKPGTPASTRIKFNVFFVPESVRIELERPERRQNQDWDRTSTFKGTKKFKDDTFRIVMAGELVRLICVAGELDVKNPSSFGHEFTRKTTLGRTKSFTKK